MSGGSSLPYGNMKNAWIFAGTPTGGSVSSTSVYILGTYGTVVSFLVPGVLPGDCILDVNRLSNTISGNTAPAAPYVGIGNAWVYSAGNISCVLSNSSVIAYVTTPIETYTIAVGRPDTTNPPTTTPTGVY
jgi:hypothetical protein